MTTVLMLRADNSENPFRKADGQKFSVRLLSDLLDTSIGIKYNVADSLLAK